MNDSEVDKAVKKTQIEHLSRKKVQHQNDLHTAKDDLSVTQEQLDAALAYFEKLKPSCIQSGVSYEDRVARRQAEIQSLNEALQILAGEDV